MRKYIILLMLMAIGLSACLPVNITPTTAPKSSPVPTAGLTVPNAAEVLPDSGCTVVTQKPTPGPTAKPNYPSVTASDWVKGPANARVTLIEYSDFQ